MKRDWAEHICYVVPLLDSFISMAKSCEKPACRHFTVESYRKCHSNILQMSRVQGNWSDIINIILNYVNGALKLLPTTLKVNKPIFFVLRRVLWESFYVSVYNGVKSF